MKHVPLLEEASRRLDVQTIGSFAVSYLPPERWISERWRESLRVFDAGGKTSAEIAVGAVEAGEAARRWGGSFALFVVGKRFAIMRSGIVLAVVKDPTSDELEAAFKSATSRIQPFVERQLDRSGLTTPAEDALALEILEGEIARPSDQDLAAAEAYVRTGALRAYGPTVLWLLEREARMRRELRQALDDRAEFKAAEVLRDVVENLRPEKQATEQRLRCGYCAHEDRTEAFESRGSIVCPECGSRQVSVLEPETRNEKDSTR